LLAIHNPKQVITWRDASFTSVLGWR
jgi:hypothetical protein